MYKDIERVLSEECGIKFANPEYKAVPMTTKKGDGPNGEDYFYEGKSTAISVRPGMFYIMFPSDGHRPGCHQEFPKHYRKVVVKIPVEK